jgi:hypothetical protein
MTDKVRAQTLHSLRVAALHSLSTRYLAESGSVSLGTLLMGINSPEASCDPDLIEYDGIFVGATEKDLEALYEPTLNLLERDLGPLICEEPSTTPSNDDRTWGYAGYIGHAGAIRTPSLKSPLAPAHNRMLWLERSFALQTGHPDQLEWENGRIPRATWRRARP